MRKMITGFDCFPCFTRQTVQSARLIAPGDEKLQREIVKTGLGILADAEEDISPPDLAGRIFRAVLERTHIHDLFAEDKRLANAKVLELLPGLEARIADASNNGGDPLLTALGLAIIGNYIDAGAPLDVDWEQALHDEEHASWSQATYPGFKRAVERGPKTIILGDNAGEIGLDTLLVKELQSRGCEVTYAVRGRPVLNDATLEDAEVVGMDTLCRVVTSGVDTPGTVLGRCLPEFIREMEKAELILSKGQGNFEALYGRWPGVYYAFKAKCSVMADFMGVAQGTSLFTRHEDAE